MQVYMWPGRSPEEKKQLISGITQVFVDMGVPPEAVRVLIQEVPKDSWGGGGVPATEWER